MQCECGEHEATIHEVVIRNGVKRERHLCERCAAAMGYDPDGSGVSGESLLDQLGPILPTISAGQDSAGQEIPGSGAQGGHAADAEAQTSPALSSAKSGGMTAASTTAAAGKARACPGCGIGFEDFRRTGLLGCSRCYEAFESRLSPIIERAQQRGSRHLGKVPRRALERSRANQQSATLLGDQADRQARLEALRGQLGVAIHQEDYERAARVRDELQRLCSQDELLDEPLQETDGVEDGPERIEKRGDAS